MNNFPADLIQRIVTCDALEYLQALPDACVPLHLFSPPYNLGRRAEVSAGPLGHYADTAKGRARGGMGLWNGSMLERGYDDYSDDLPWPEYRDWQHALLRQCWRTLTEDGAIFYVHKPRVQGGGCVLPTEYNPGLPLRQVIIWQRAGGVNFAPTHYLPTCEWLLILAKPGFRLRSKGASGVGDVWRIPQETGRSDAPRHPAPFPLALARRVLETVQPSLVLDVMIGRGTTAAAAVDMGVEYAGCDRNPGYVAMAQEWVATRQQQPSLWGVVAPVPQQAAFEWAEEGD